MSRLRGRSQNRESPETRPEGTGAAFPRQHFGAAKARPRLMGLLLALVTLLVYLDVTQKALELASGAPIKNLKGIQQRLRLYRSHQPWRESFQFTNAPVIQ